ncbi:pyridoxal phosphate-dependent aminotransferase [Abyssalbus ytuae]|uniref:Aminotransferase n=1 Tax=Abyssalbus ytuae TaxID=2926907 RepID=A0A9E6ZSD9_9FLAO|nr:pyridoxal phosphate-dependent aminotransferase [Abyssalbus ytuae]UOB16993.1 pyridoxal phosphate-dependent aminotransferase [Abyssalbus ytuae]
MPFISDKGHKMPESPIRKLVPFAENAKKRGTKVYHLNIGQPDIKTPNIAIDAVKNCNIEVLEYGKSQGFDSFREKIALYYKNININLDKDDIIVTTGGSEALIFTIATIADEGDEIIISEPFYANYKAFATNVGVKIVPIHSSIDDNFALPPVSKLEKMITPKTRAILITNPGNPTGYLYTQKEIEELIQLAKKHDIYIVSDEVYREFVYDNSKHFSVLQVEGADENTIVIDSVSKRYSMCGARIGYMISKNKKVMSTALKFAQARLSPPIFAQIASEAALDTPESYFEEISKEYLERRNTLISGLEKIDGVKVGKPNGAFYCIAELPVKNADDFAQWLLEKFDLNGETVMIAPGAGFYSTPGVGLNQVRIAYVLKKEDLEKSVKILEAALKAYNARD